MNLDKKFTKYPFLFLNDHKSKLFEEIQNYNSKIFNNPNNDENDCLIVKDIFMSDENTLKIQKKLQKNVFNKSKKKYTIPYQKKESVKMVMEYIHTQYGKSVPYKINEQIKELNDLVVKELTPNIINNLISYDKYLIDINKRPTLLELPKNVSLKGAKVSASLEQ